MNILNHSLYINLEEIFTINENYLSNLSLVEINKKNKHLKYKII